jgi:hypothetical protein
MVHPRELVILADGGVGHGRHEVLYGAITEGVVQAVGSGSPKETSVPPLPLVYTCQYALLDR